MRLIDADELKRAIEDRIDYVPSNDYDEGWNSAINTAIDEIDNAPTVERPQVNVIPQECMKVLAEVVVDVVQQIDWKALCEKMAERPKGKWIIEHDWVHCFSCGHEQNYPSNFCPNCGAQMQKGGAE